MAGRKRGREDDGDAAIVENNFYSLLKSRINEFITKEEGEDDEGNLISQVSMSFKPSNYTLGVVRQDNTGGRVFHKNDQSNTASYASSSVWIVEQPKTRTPESLTKHLAYLLLKCYPKCQEVQVELTEKKDAIYISANDANPLFKGLTSKDSLNNYEYERDGIKFIGYKVCNEKLTKKLKSVKNQVEHLDLRIILYKKLLQIELNDNEKKFKAEFLKASTAVEQNRPYLSNSFLEDLKKRLLIEYNQERQILDNSNIYVVAPGHLADNKGRHAETKLPMLEKSTIYGTKRPCLSCALYFKLHKRFNLINNNIGKYWNTKCSYNSLCKHYANSRLNFEEWWDGANKDAKDLFEIPFRQNPTTNLLNAYRENSELKRDDLRDDNTDSEGGDDDRGLGNYDEEETDGLDAKEQAPFFDIELTYPSRSEPKKYAPKK